MGLVKGEYMFDTFVKPEDVKLKIDDETKLVSIVAALLFDNHTEPVKAAFILVDGVILIQEARMLQRIEAENKRRKGY